MEVLQQESVIRTRTLPVIDLEFLKAPKTADSNSNDDVKTKEPKELKKYLTASNPQVLPGHTGFLTFATLPPNIPKAWMDAQLFNKWTVFYFYLTLVLLFVVVRVEFVEELSLHVSDTATVIATML